MLKERLTKFGLAVSEEKSRIIKFGRYVWQEDQKEKKAVETFDFLGVTHYCDKTRKGEFKLGHKTARVKLTQKVKATRQWLRNIRNLLPFSEWWETLKVKLVGHYRYYGISGNMKGLKMFYEATTRLAYEWINRRSQKKIYTFESFCRLLKYNPLPKPKIYQQLYTLSSY
jgi:hypothetical protein